MKRIVFLNEALNLTYKDPETSDHGGIEYSTISLAQTLAISGHQVYIATDQQEKSRINHVQWIHHKDVRNLTGLDVAISNNRINSFRLLPSGQIKKIVWQHNPFSFEKSIRKKQLAPCIKYRPDIVLVGETHRRTVSHLIPYKKRHVIEHGLGNAFRCVTVSPDPKKRVVWVSQKQRGLNETLLLWCNHISEQSKDSSFHIFGIRTHELDIREEEIKKFNIVLHPRASKQELAEFYADSRLMIYPGAKDETFCFAAAEAMMAGVPVLTRGIGSLAERVCHGTNGIIEPNSKRYIQAAVKVMEDDDYWRSLRTGALQLRGELTWEECAKKWEAIF
jgi:glycosyltransferase involved in cell wall biosynthesis